MFAASKTASVSGGYQISRSLRFNSADSAYLNRTPASAGNKQTWTLSVWVKRGSLGAFNPIYSAGATSPRAYLIFNSSDKMDFRSVDSGNTEVIRLTTTQVFRDPSAWYHVVVAQDTTQATSSNRLKIYVNGTQVTAFDTATYPSQNISNLAINDALEQNYGRYVNSPSDGYLSAYLTETNFIDGQALTPSSFGETNTQTGVWQPKAYSGSYGTNGFYLNFSDNSNTTAATLGKDYSGNGNNWTPNNFSVTAGAGNDSLVDSPTAYGTDTGVGGTVRGNYATLNPLSIVANASLSNGNLDATNTSGSNYRTFVSTINLPSDSWYCEFTAGANTSGDNMFVGICPTSSALSSTYIGSSSTSYAYSSNGTKYNNASATSYGASFTNGDVIGVAFNGSTLTFYKNGTSQGSAFTSLSGDFVLGVSLWGTAVCTANFGQRPFAYTAPSGYKALCTQNLPTPTIGATTATQAGKYFNTVLYTGTDSAQTITGVGFQPDYVWLKNRTAANAPKNLDVLRGAGWSLSSAETGAEANQTNAFTAFTSDGFSVATNGGEYNASGRNYVAWNWKANGSGSSNTAGSITSTVSANTTSGFSVVTYTGTGSNATVGHGLGVAPSFIIIKRRDAGSSWNCYQITLGASQYIQIDGTAGAATNTGVWNNTAPTSSVFSIGTAFAGVNASGSTHVAYCFAEVAGYSKFGSYTGNGSADGPFVYTGFRPAFVMTKRTDLTSEWTITDLRRPGYNLVNKSLYANQSSAELTYNVLDQLSNGFKLRDPDGIWNGSGGTYIYMAFAENPFKYSLAR